METTYWFGAEHFADTASVSTSTSTLAAQLNRAASFSSYIGKQEEI